MIRSPRAPAWRRSGETVLGLPSPNLLSHSPPRMLRAAAATICRKTKTRGETHESVSRHHRVFQPLKERARDLYDPRDLVAAHSISGVGVFLFLSRPRQS